MLESSLLSPYLDFEPEMFPDVLSVSPLSERTEELWVVCVFISKKWSYAIGGKIVTRNKNKLVGDQE